MSRITANRQKQLRKLRNSSRIHGTAERPRLSVVISNRGITAQVIDDDQSLTIFGATVKRKEADKVASAVVKAVKDKKITKLVLDRGDKAYHGKLAEIADLIRKEGIAL